MRTRHALLALATTLALGCAARPAKSEAPVGEPDGAGEPDIAQSAGDEPTDAVPPGESRTGEAGTSKPAKRNWEPRVSGPGHIEPMLLLHRFRVRHKEILDCYHDARAASRRRARETPPGYPIPKFTGGVVLSFSIGTSGEVKRVSAARGSLQDGVLRRCLEDEVQTWSFPEPSGGAVHVIYPMWFS